VSELRAPPGSVPESVRDIGEEIAWFQWKMAQALRLPPWYILGISKTEWLLKRLAEVLA
jgi:hypothetical protein